MRKLFALIFIIAVAVIILTPQPSMAGNTYAITSNKILGVGVSVGADSTLFNLEQWWKSNIHYSVFLLDTITLGVAVRDTVIDLGDYYSSINVSSLNGAGASCYVQVCPAKTYHVKGIWHNDSFAQNYILATLRAGCNSTDSSVTIPMSTRYLHLRQIVAGTADSVTLVRIQGWR